MARTGLHWRRHPKDLGAAYISWGNAVEIGADQFARGRSGAVTRWMKANAPWTDRTGDARRLLHSFVERRPRGVIRLVIAHGVDYGQYLENRFEGKWGIVRKAAAHFARDWARFFRAGGAR